MIDKELASKLREQGLGYEQIAEQLGCSVSWCKTNLKQVKKYKDEQEAIDCCVQKSKQRQAITSLEITKEILKVHKFDNSKEHKLEQEKITKKFKQKVRDSKGIVRPYWMPADRSVQALDLVVAAVNSLDERLYEKVMEILEELEITPDTANISSFSAVILSLMYGNRGQAKAGVGEQFSRLSAIADELSIRNKQP